MVFALKSLSDHNQKTVERAFPKISDAFSVCEEENEFLCLNTAFLTTTHMMIT